MLVQFYLQGTVEATKYYIVTLKLSLRHDTVYPVLTIEEREDQVRCYFTCL